MDFSAEGCFIRRVEKLCMGGIGCEVWGMSMLATVPFFLKEDSLTCLQPAVP